VVSKLENWEWLRENFLCMKGCPVNTEAGRYVNLIAQGQFADAYRVARTPNPFASICGRICSAPCEDACRRGKLDQPIAIRALKRFVTERFGVESLIDVIKLQEVLRPVIQPKDKKIAIVGAGPAGLSCAHDLALLGYKVVVFEKQQVPGGMLRLGIPEYRLPHELIRLEINAILSLGVNLELGKTLGQDYYIQDLRNAGYDAIYLAIGSHKSRLLDIEGTEADGIFNAVNYLLNINLGQNVELGENIIVIGGGNVAFDVARIAARLGKPEAIASSDITAALDVARSSVRFGAKKVDMIVLESQKEMLADDEEVEQANEERISIHNAVGPKRIITRNGRVTGVEIWDVASIVNSEGRFAPEFVPGTERIIEAESVVIAIGQSTDLSFIQPDDNIEVSNRGTIIVNPDTLATTADGIFAGGDAAFGPRIAISAIADGRHAARSIDKFLNGSVSTNKEIKVSVFDSTSLRLPTDNTRVPRQIIPVLPMKNRLRIAEVEMGYTEGLAVKEAIRCLRCWENTIFEGNPELGTECILCGGCADVCPENCIEIIPKHTLKINEKDIKNIASEFQIEEEDISGKGMVLIKNEEICIRCGLCIRRCPVGTITMQGFEECSVSDI